MSGTTLPLQTKPSMPAQFATWLLVTAMLGACSTTGVKTEVGTGQLTGYVDDGLEYYLGIPYAAPPVGELRWRPPQPATAWQGSLKVQKNPPACAQIIPVRQSLLGSEDCLYLNVWTPSARPHSPMPVIVWLHGGGFVLGKGSYGNNDGATLARNGQVVVVSINYRLGVFGFLAHPALNEEEPSHPTSGNYGIEDQAAALRWVRDNVSAFGGDPNNITLVGQSAGGVSVCTQLVSPLARGLFQRAIIQSGPCALPLPTLAQASQQGTKVERGVGCDQKPDVLACMRSRPAQEVADVLSPNPGFGFNSKTLPWWPNLDDHVLQHQIMDAFRSGQFNQVPVINGATKDEGSLLVWLSHNMVFQPLQTDEYLDRLELLMGNRASAVTVAKRYPVEDFDSPFEALTAAFSDGFFNCLIRDQSLALSRHTLTWSYQFDYEEAPFLVPWADLKAFHAAEIQYVFGRPMRLTGGNFSARESGLAQSLMAYWVQFAHSGNPNRSEQADWPMFSHDEKTLLFNLKNTVAVDIHKQACEFWQELDYLRPMMDL